MATTVAQHINTSSSSPFTQVKVNVRLCGSIPRTEMDALCLKQQQPQQTVEMDRGTILPTVVTNEADSVAQQLCSQLSTFQQHYPQSAPTRLPTFEPPSWAVPASGESRLEVSMEQ
jgi:hypothetical protein